MFDLYQRNKTRLNSLADQVLDICNRIIDGTFQLSWPLARTWLEAVARFIGDLSRLFQEFPRRTVYKMVGANWTIVFVGENKQIENIAEIQHLFFDGEKVVLQELERVSLWNLPTQCQRWWAEGVDLVVGASSLRAPYWPKVPLRFSVPGWIQQVLELPENLGSLLSGSRMKVVRQALNHAQKANFSWYFSQAKDDFEYFYRRMYLPNVEERHGSRAIFSPYEWLYRQFMRGGLIVVTQNGTQVGGGLGYVDGKTYFGIEMGMLDNNPELLRQGIKTSSYWFSINWAHQQGIRKFDMGNTRPWRSNGVFFYKSRWRPKIVRYRKLYGHWVFLAQDNMKPDLQKRINQIGFISEIKGKFYAIILETEQFSLSTTEIDQELSLVQKEGLDGLLVISADKVQIIPIVNSTE